MDDANQKCQTVSSFLSKRFCIQIMSLSKQDGNDTDYVSYTEQLSSISDPREIIKRLLELTQEP